MDSDAPTLPPADSEPEVLTFREEMTHLINRYSRENGSDTPDFLLANYVLACLEAFDNATRDRDAWHGFRPWNAAALDSEAPKSKDEILRGDAS